MLFAFKDNQLLVDYSHWNFYWEVLRLKLDKMLVGYLNDTLYDGSLIESNFKQIYIKRLRAFLEWTPVNEVL